ncbi:dihydropteroate synthase [Agrilactobacillus composti DSM 18527 = JCM 14202]|uniref:Dihydropteroate synthase n=1 Tax=Agrilactobacillus composti DSM 18527 = JCM 14202 TaxID=1423734 RepID=X0PTR1_9LACO|nr:dihydropteroate synthase [Agrilactobacillus composti]KRM36315.1 dihydropteroate synthase [Agrilactobacillus composti DSM 18527 = JCM 14202]GAF41437.1 dihydropteroate synthase [Agrilactobacillus composti DSM 18527 = JCM 14202]
MELTEVLISDTLAGQTIFDPFNVDLKFTETDSDELAWLIPLWADLDVTLTQVRADFKVHFNIYQFKAFVAEINRRLPNSTCAAQLAQIWAAHQLWWRGRDFELDLTTTPIVYSILNTSPDSFYDGGVLQNVDDVIRRAEVDVANGAKVLEVGGQTTRPGFTEVTPEVELQRVLPEIKAIQSHFPDVLIAVDTYKTPVMQAVLDAGVHIINDVNGFRDDPAKLALLKTYQPAVLTMHENRGKPYKDDLTSNVQGFFEENLALLAKAVPYDHIALDQGIGYSAKADNIQDFAFMRTLDKLNLYKRPTMVAVSNKGFYGKLLGLAKDDRLLPTIISETLMIQQGGRLIRVHDSKATADMIKLLDAINNSFLIDKSDDEIK